MFKRDCEEYDVESFVAEDLDEKLQDDKKFRIRIVGIIDSVLRHAPHIDDKRFEDYHIYKFSANYILFIPNSPQSVIVYQICETDCKVIVECIGSITECISLMFGNVSGDTD